MHEEILEAEHERKRSRDGGIEVWEEPGEGRLRVAAPLIQEPGLDASDERHQAPPGRGVGMPALFLL